MICVSRIDFWWLYIVAATFVIRIMCGKIALIPAQDMNTPVSEHMHCFLNGRIVFAPAYELLRHGTVN